MNKEFNLQQFIISVVIIGVILIMGIYITSSIQDVMRTPGYANSVVNDSNARATDAGITLSKASLLNGACGTITAVFNGTGGVAIPIANLTQVGCVVTNKTTTAMYASATWLYSYPYTFTNDTASSTAAGNVTTALATGTSWISILVVVGFATIILTMLTSGLGQAAQQQGATPYY